MSNSNRYALTLSEAGQVPGWMAPKQIASCATIAEANAPHIISKLANRTVLYVKVWTNKQRNTDGDRTTRTFDLDTKEH